MGGGLVAAVTEVNIHRYGYALTNNITVGFFFVMLFSWPQLCSQPVKVSHIFSLGRGMMRLRAFAMLDNPRYIQLAGALASRLALASD